MPPRKKTAKPAAPVPKLLPKNRHAILVLQRAVEKLLNFLEPMHHGEVMRLTELQETFKDPLRIVRKRVFLKAIEEANQQRFAQGGPSISVLVPYVDAAEMKTLLDRHKAARGKLVSPDGAKAGDLQAWQPAVTALGEVVVTERAIIQLFRDVQQRLIAALDATEPSSAGKTNQSAGKKLVRRVRLPKNDNVFRLAKAINDRADEEPSQIDIARQFTGGDEKKARNLLRQLRRYRHLIRT